MIESRLIQVMAEKKIKRQELAEKSGVSPSTISKMRNNIYPTRIEVDTVDKLCAVLECSVGDLYVFVKD
jgi:DNA-binding Xre family transcriptional regulator